MKKIFLMDAEMKIFKQIIVDDYAEIKYDTIDNVITYENDSIFNFT